MKDQPDFAGYFYSKTLKNEWIGDNEFETIMTPNVSEIPQSIMVIDETEYNKKYSNHDQRTNFYE